MSQSLSLVIWIRYELVFWLIKRGWVLPSWQCSAKLIMLRNRLFCITLTSLGWLCEKRLIHDSYNGLSRIAFVKLDKLIVVPELKVVLLKLMANQITHCPLSTWYQLRQPVVHFNFLYLGSSLLKLFLSFAEQLVTRAGKISQFSKCVLRSFI